MRVVAVTNQKGGVGKTTTAHHLAVALARRGERVLAVDMDPQGHLSLACGVVGVETSLHEVLSGTLALADVVRVGAEGVLVAPADQLMMRTEIEQVGRLGWGRRLSDALASVADTTDWCVVDTPPSLGFLTVNALVAARDGVVVPVVPELYPLKGVQLLQRTLSEVRQENPALVIRAVVPTMVRAGWRSHAEVIARLPEWFPGVPVAASVPAHGAVVRAARRGRSVFDLFSSCAVARAYVQLAEALCDSVRVAA